MFANQSQSGGGLFGASASSSGQNKPTLSLFGPSTSTSQPQQGGGLFGASQNQQQQGGGLFGSSTNASQPQQGGALFGSSLNASQSQQGGGLFGSSTNQPQQQQGGGLFGNLNKPQTGGVFGQSTQQNQGGGLFGQSTQQQNQGGSLFGQPAQQNQGGSLFGQPAQQNQGGGLFGQSTQQNQGGSLWGTSTQPQQQQQQGLGGSMLGASQQTQNRLGGSVWGPQQVPARERSIPDQMGLILGKWAPHLPTCAMDFYFYNLVDEKDLPFYNCRPEEDPQRWEEALANRPTPNSVPVLGRGFEAVAARIKQQIIAVQLMRARLKAMNEALEEMIKKHDTENASRIAAAKRRHTALSQTCLRLAIKTQVLRNRGYAMDGAEEGLKRMLIQLERAMFDPVLGAHADEIYARLFALRERAKVLDDEGRRLGVKAQEQTIDLELMEMVKKLLSDYDIQLSHLDKEVGDITKEYSEWEAATKPLANGASGR